MEKNSDYKFLLENKLLSGALKLFALLISVASSEDKKYAEKNYVSDFFEKLYSFNVTDYLAAELEKHLESLPLLEYVADEINHNAKYEEKVFLLMKSFEMLCVTKVQIPEENLMEKSAELLGIDDSDYKFIRNIYYKKEKIAESKNIKILYITGKNIQGDVLFENNNLSVELYKVMDSFYIINRNIKSFVYLGEYFLDNDFVTKIHENEEILIENYRAIYEKHSEQFDYVHNVDIITEKYRINYENIKYYFDTKYSNLIKTKKKIYINTDGAIIYIGEEKESNSVIEIEIDGFKNTLNPINKNTSIMLNGRGIKDSHNVNINDVLKIDGTSLNLKRIIIDQMRDELVMGDNSAECIIGNDEKSHIVIKDDFGAKWHSKILLDNEIFIFDKGNCPHPVFINNKETKLREKVGNGEAIFIGKNVISIDEKNFIIKRQYFSFKSFVVNNLEYYFDRKTKGIDNISLEAERGEMIAIMGPSGSGKSTLLNLMNGNYKPASGEIFVNSLSFDKYYDFIKRYIGYVPQDDLILENLTVFENLYYGARLRFPDMDKNGAEKLVNSVLKDIDLLEKKNATVGSINKKFLSGGERKRLNIGLELLSDSEIFFIDEPTSGLSSSDAEKITEVLKRIALKGKIVFVAIHQPSSRIYQNFDKVAVLDKGGKLAYFGDIYAAVEYFRIATGFSQVKKEEFYSDVNPEILLNVLEEPLKNIDGTSLDIRKFSPDEWKERFSIFSQDEIKMKTEIKDDIVLPDSNKVKHGFLSQFRTLFMRNFKNKLRNRSNILITFIEAPLLAFISSFILRYDNYNDTYTLYSNTQIKIFIFVTVIITLFLGVTNSITEIIGDRHILIREKFFDIKNRNYFVAKFTTLSIFAIVQNILYVFISFYILKIKEMHFHYILFLSTVSLCGIAIGLFISSIKQLSEKAALNIVPLILIPQIILGGSLLKYEDMNRQLTNFRKVSIPVIAEIMPSRWAYEGLIVMQDSYNSFSNNINKINEKINKLSQVLDSVEEGSTEYENAKLESEKLKVEREKLKNEKMEIYGNSEIEEYVRSTNEKYEMNVEEVDSKKDEINMLLDKYKIVSNIGILERLNSAFEIIRNEVSKIILINENTRSKIEKEYAFYKLKTTYPDYSKMYENADEQKISTESLINNGEKFIADNIGHVEELKKNNEKAASEIEVKLLELYSRISELQVDYQKLKEYKDSYDMVERYPLFIKEKKVKGTNIAVSTVVYNGTVMGMFIFLISMMSLLMLRFEKRGVLILNIIAASAVLIYLKFLFF